MYSYRQTIVTTCLRDVPVFYNLTLIQLVWEGKKKLNYVLWKLHSYDLSCGIFPGHDMNNRNLHAYKNSKSIVSSSRVLSEFQDEENSSFNFQFHLYIILLNIMLHALMGRFQLELFYLFFHRRPTHKLRFLSCRPFVINVTFSTGLVECWSFFCFLSSVNCQSQKTEEALTPYKTC